LYASEPKAENIRMATMFLFDVLPMAFLNKKFHIFAVPVISGSVNGASVVPASQFRASAMLL
jgi:hypothetical protein